MKEIIEIYYKARKIYDSDDLTWEEKYDLIFSKEISAKVNFEWYDPDMDYQDDVQAFMWAFDEYYEKIKRMSQFTSR